MSDGTERPILGIDKCGCCGMPVQIKLNKNRNAYYFCGHQNEQGENCAHQVRWGKPYTAKLIRKFKGEPDEPSKFARPAPNSPRVGTYEEYLT